MKLEILNSGLTEVPDLPPGITKLILTDNYITRIENLPETLIDLNVTYNNTLVEIVNLPSKLKYLRCAHCNLTNLPPLPSSLLELDCGNNKLESLPSLPKNLQILRCGKNLLSSLPTLPSSLKILICKENSIQKIPSIPSNITKLDVSGNLIETLPKLPSNLKFLDCSNLPLKTKISFPSNLETLICKNLNLTNLDFNFLKLKNLDCSNNLITEIPFMYKLESLNCSNNNIEVLNVPPNLKVLEAKSSHIREIDMFHNKLQYINVSDNLLHFLPKLPPSLLFLSFNSNPMLNIPAFPSSLRFISYYNTYFAEDSIPNKYRYISDLSLISIIEYNGMDVELLTIPKGTVLFRNLKGELLSDFLGVKSYKDPDNYYLFPNHQVFFYQSPFALDSIAEYPNMVAFYTTKDVKVVLGIYPGTMYRNLEIENFSVNCGEYKISSIYPGVKYDMCFDDEFMKQYPDVVGKINISDVDGKRHIQVAYDYPQIAKYYHYSEDSKGNIGVPEIALHPRRIRVNTEIVSNEKDINENFNLEESKDEYNYYPLIIGEHRKFQQDEFYMYVEELISPQGLAINDKTYHMTIDTRTKMYVLYEEASEETKKHCIPIKSNIKTNFI